MVETNLHRFTKKCVRLAKRVVDDGSEPAEAEGGGRFAEWTMLPLHCLRIHMRKSYRMTLDYLKEMPRICGEIGLDITDLPHYTTLCDWFDQIKINTPPPSDFFPNRQRKESGD